MTRSAFLIPLVILLAAFASDESKSNKKSANLVQNGGFEKGAARKGPEGWQRPDGLCSFWTEDPSRPGKVMKFDTNVLLEEFRQRREEMKQKDPPPPREKTPPQPGQKYKTVAAHDGVGFVSDPIPVEKGRSYCLSVDCRGESYLKKKVTPKVFVLGYFELRGAERRGYKAHKNCPAEAKWSTHTMEFNPTARSSQVTHIRVKLFPYWPPGTYYFDNVRIEAVEMPDEAPKERDDG